MFPKAVFFDLDNTLTHRALSIARYSERFHFAFRDHLKEKNAGNINAIIIREDNGGYLPKNSPFSSIREAVSQSLALELKWIKLQLAETVLEHWINHFHSAAVLMPGANELIEELMRHDIAIGVISNGAEWSRNQTLEALSLTKKIQVMICSERFGHSKPSPKIFHAGANVLDFHPEQCWYVGDHPVNDYLGAKNAGMKAIWLKGFHEWPRNWVSPEHSVCSLNELTTLLTQL
ncbi:hydrolase (plasmid) [Erwinia persicina]|uniref:HAD family hydrolase n=1 Tax=Erwinia persicina TaxID=55211 RepID=UPI000E4BF847|nr:HAD family hydrolase [Erwinia persicina]AXU98015.1 hydrolase [Erwinia persicina]